MSETFAGEPLDPHAMKVECARLRAERDTWKESYESGRAECVSIRAELAVERERAGKLKEACHAGIRLMATAEDALRECQEQRDKLREALVKASDDLDDALQHSDVDGEKVVAVRNAIDALLAATKEDTE